jgi:hypothetical protein
MARVIKLGLISLVVFSLLITGISLFFPSHVRISKAIDIETNKDSLLDQLKDLSLWKNWYPGADTMQLLLVDGVQEGLQVDAEQGLIRLTGINDSVITAITTGPRVREVKSGWNIFEGSRPNMITIQWYMDFHLRWYPWEKFSSLLLEKRYGPAMEKGLDKLKAYLERGKQAP